MTYLENLVSIIKMEIGARRFAGVTHRPEDVRDEVLYEVAQELMQTFNTPVCSKRHFEFLMDSTLEKPIKAATLLERIINGDFYES